MVRTLQWGYYKYLQVPVHKIQTIQQENGVLIFDT